MSRWPRTASPTWSSWRSTLLAERGWRALLASPSWRAGPGVPLAQVYAELPDRAGAAARARAAGSTPRCSPSTMAELDGMTPARAGVRADHAPARRHGALQGGPARARPRGRRAIPACSPPPAATSTGSAAACSMPPRPRTARPRRRWRGGCWARSTCGPSRSGSTTTRPTWRVPWPSSIAACSRRRRPRNGSPASAASAPARPRHGRRLERARRLIDFQLEPPLHST